MKGLPLHVLKLAIISTLVFSPIANANGNRNGGSNGGGNNGNPGCQNGCSGNNGNGVGNTGPGNQGNTGSNGNAGGVTTGNGNGGTGSTAGGSTGGGQTGSSTGGFNGGNNGNGVGNTGPGNQGNDSSNGNAGGTTGSTNGGTNGNANGNGNGGTNGNANGNGNGGTNGNANGNGNGGTGSTAGGSTGGGQTGSSTGGFNGGNNGNGVGNTGPGNQGNDSDNGNAGGTSGSTNGGTNGNAQGNSQGGTNGNAQGNSQGGTNGNAQGNSQGGTNGNAQGNSQGGTNGNAQGNAEGGFTGGGTTGETAGGSTGGETAGGSEGGSTGGETTGNSEGGSTGGETTGNSEGGSTGGETTGNSEGGSTGGEQAESKPERKLKARLLPLAFGNYDILTKAVNLTLHPQSDIKRNAGEISVMLDDYRAGFQVTQIRSWNLGLGVAPQLYLSNASGLAALTTGLAGLAVTKNRFVQYERLVKDEAELQTLNVLPLPFSKQVVDSYANGESVYFENTGGVLFMGGVGMAGAFAGGSMVAEGGWKTLVAKTGEEKVLVQIAKASIKSTSLFTGVAVLAVDATKVQQLNQGFTYEFDFAKGGSRAIEAYEAMLTGNMTIAQELGQNAVFSGVTPVNAYTHRETNRRRGGAIGIPMVAMYNWATGRVYGEQATLAYADKTTTDLNYGVFFKEQKGRFFHKHKRLLRSFYSGVAVTKNESQKVVGIEEKASFLWSYETDNGTSSKLNDAVEMFHRDLGVKKAFAPTIDSGKKLNYVRLEAKIDIPASFTGKMIAAMRSERSLETMRAQAESMINDYIAAGDESDLCTNDDTEKRETISTCRSRLISETRSALTRIRTNLLSLNAKTEASDYTASYALMGKELIKNQFVLNSFFSYDNKCELKYELKLDGRRLNKMVKLVPANISCR